MGDQTLLYLSLLATIQVALLVFAELSVVYLSSITPCAVSALPFLSVQCLQKSTYGSQRAVHGGLVLGHD